MFKLVVYLILFIFVQNNFYNVSSYSTGAGTCKIEEMATIGHGTLFGPAKSGTGGYAITVNGKTGSFDVSVGQKGSVKGLLLYAMDSATKTRTGNFVISDTSNFQPKDCQGDGGVNTITHSNPSIKNLPMKFTWMPTNGAKSNNITFRALVVESKNSWYTLQDVTVNLATGTPSTSTANNPSDSSTSNSSSSTTDDGLGSWFKRYLLFVVMIIITTFLYVIGSIVELMLKKQNSKARSFAKTVGGFGIAK